MTELQTTYSQATWKSLELQSVKKDVDQTPTATKHKYKNYAYAFIMLTLKSMNYQESQMQLILALENIRSQVQAIIDKIQDLMGKLTDMKFTYSYTGKDGDTHTIEIDPSKFSKDDWKNGNLLDNQEAIAKYINANKTGGEQIAKGTLPVIDWTNTWKNNTSVSRIEFLQQFKSAYQSLVGTKGKEGLLAKLKQALKDHGEKDPENTPIYIALKSLIDGLNDNLGSNFQNYLDGTGSSDDAFIDLVKVVKGSWGHTHAPSDKQADYTDTIATQRDLDSTAGQVSTSLSNTDSTETSYMMQKFTQFDKVGQDGLRDWNSQMQTINQNMAKA